MTTTMGMSNAQSAIPIFRSKPHFMIHLREASAQAPSPLLARTKIQTPPHTHSHLASGFVSPIRVYDCSLVSHLYIRFVFLTIQASLYLSKSGQSKTTGRRNSDLAAPPRELRIATRCEVVWRLGWRRRVSHLHFKAQTQAHERSWRLRSFTSRIDAITGVRDRMSLRTKRAIRRPASLPGETRPTDRCNNGQ
jgi:hypothetical protein